MVAVIGHGGDDDELFSYSGLQLMQLIIWLVKFYKELQTDFPEIGKVVFV